MQQIKIILTKADLGFVKPLNVNDNYIAITSRLFLSLEVKYLIPFKTSPVGLVDRVTFPKAL